MPHRTAYIVYYVPPFPLRSVRQYVRAKGKPNERIYARRFETPDAAEMEPDVMRLRESGYRVHVVPYVLRRRSDVN